MSDVVISPNMNLPVPVVGTEPGPDWAEDINACMSAIDSHSHASGQGVQVTPDGLNINSDLPFTNKNATVVRSVNFNAQSAPLATAADIGCVYVSGKDLYYNDEDGNQVRITQGGSVTGSSGTITGLPSGTASASFAAGTFTFQSATNTAAAMRVGPVAISAQVANAKTVTLEVDAALAANYAMSLPLALPGSTSIINCDASGNQGFVAPDNVSFGVDGGTYQVLDDGLTTAKYADESVTNAKLAPVVLDYSTMASDYNLTATVFTTITGMSSTIAGTGRAAMIILTTDISTAAEGSIFNNDATTILYMQIKRGSTVIADTFVSITASHSILPAWTVIDPSPPAGTNSYSLLGKVNAGGDLVKFTSCSLVAMEL